MKKLLLAAGFAAVSFAAQADAVDTLKNFVREVKSGQANFTQTVTSPDGAKKKTSSGSFEFLRPNRFRFAYVKPFEQLIVADGQKVWIYDADLEQVSTRRFSQALGATPAAILAGGSLEKDFDLAALPARDGLEWAEATPKATDGAFQSVRIGFLGRDLAAVEITDSFGQRSLLQFQQFIPNAPVSPESFKFTVPAGADVIEQ
ncbi:outer membrane lipoprotein chaperone LolA [Piscinibacter sp.]|uniref:outer membrane lipoprotein chaperone LolA n=1 Tax=Piscinibacter sp. TaxID=1903157 RepID=UPI002CAD2B39|nr:outer membrane lipoprotein chaperone LolA [Albitalea sp.]HUG23142.1 outer membrane lipoprotein chaperone LolA [Albitalea sp.]